MAWLVLVLSIGAIFLLMLMIREGEMSKVASLFYLVPAVTAIMAWALFGEELTCRCRSSAWSSRRRRRRLATSAGDAGPRGQIAADRGVEFAAEDEDQRDDVEEHHRDHDRRQPA
jgi:hypothetical protein